MSRAMCHAEELGSRAASSDVLYPSASGAIYPPPMSMSRRKKPPSDEETSLLPVLKQVRFQGWKSFRDATLHIDPLTVLIGANASGKSNALDGLQLLHRLSLGTELEVALSGNESLAPLRGGAEWAVLHGQTRFTMEVTVQGEEKHTAYRYGITIDTDPRVEFRDEWLQRVHRRPSLTSRPNVTELLNAEKVGDNGSNVSVRFHGRRGYRLGIVGRVPVLGRLTTPLIGGVMPEEVRAGANTVARALGGIFVLDPIPSLMRGFSPLAETLRSDAANIAGVLAALPKAEKKNVEAALQRYLRKLPEREVRKVWAEPVGRFKSDAMLYCEEAWTRKGAPLIIDARGMSDGTLRLLAIITALLTRPEGSLLVIEEVDNGLHPSRSELLLRTLRELGEKRRIDVVVTTHNPALLDALGPELIPFVTVAHRDPSTGASVLTLLEELATLPKLMAGGSLGALSARGAIERSLEQEAPTS